MPPYELTIYCEITIENSMLNLKENSKALNF